MPSVLWLTSLAVNRILCLTNQNLFFFSHNAEKKKERKKERKKKERKKKRKKMEWTWSYGDPPERSPRPMNLLEQNQEAQTPQIPQEILDMQKALSANNAYLQSLHCDDEDIYNSNSAKREHQYNRMAEREQLPQIGRNPFLEGTNNYVDDVSIRDQFLKPVSTSMGKNTTGKEGETK